MSKTVAPYGLWESPITVDTLTGENVTFDGIVVNEATGAVYVVESSPSECGRSTVQELSGGSTRNVLPQPYDVGSTIYEYGGGAIAIRPDGCLIFCDKKLNGVFCLDPTSCRVEVIIEANDKMRYSDFDVNLQLPEWILAIKEDHENKVDDQPKNSIVAICSTTSEVYELITGADFYNHARFSPDGNRLCWNEWNHPHMPWRETTFMAADWNRSTTSNKESIGGGHGIMQSNAQPRWGRDGSLLFANDASGYWQLYKFVDHPQHIAQTIKLPGPDDADFAGRESYLGDCTYACLTDTTVIAACMKCGTSSLILIDLEHRTYKTLGVGLVQITRQAVRRISDTQVAVIGCTLDQVEAVYRITIGNEPSVELLRNSSSSKIPKEFISQAEVISFPRTHGVFKTGESHAIFVPPKNPSFQAPAGAKPPLIVWMHGGPTYNVTPGLQMATQYFTSRGFAYVSVNHAGSTGYGRKYRDLLYGAWGDLDVADAVSCVNYLASQGRVDASRVGITGESAGGYGTLQALCAAPSVWAAGVSLYGVADPKSLIASMHKLESKYCQELIGTTALTDQEADRIYSERSPLVHVDKIRSPLLLLQGTVDTVVPQKQAEVIKKAMKDMKRDVELVLYDGEGHGFVGKDAIADSIVRTQKWWERTLVPCSEATCSGVVNSTLMSSQCA